MKNLPHMLAGALVSFVLLVSGEAAARGFAGDLLKPAAARKAAADALPASKEAVRTREVDIDRNVLRATGDALAAKRGPASIHVSLFDDTVVNIEITGRERTHGGGLALMGRVAGDLSSSAVLVDNDGVIHIAVVAGGKRYSVQGTPLSGYVAAQLGAEPMPSDHAKGISMNPVQATYARLANVQATAATTNSAKSGSGAPDDGSQIDVMVLYTPATRAAHGGVSQMEAAIDAQVAFTNLIYQNSGVIQRIRLVHRSEIAMTESGNIYKDSGRLTMNGGTPLAGQVNILRDAYRADMVSVWGMWTGACGIATVMFKEEASFESLALGLVTSPGCSGPGGATFAHELGHGMGLAHDYQSSPHSLLLTPEGSTTLTEVNYAHGYSDTTNRFRTVMSQSAYCVQQLGVDCTRIPYFSNPLLNYNNSANHPSAVNAPMGDPAYGDEARALNDVRETVANFRVSLDGPQPKALVFSQNYASVSEGGGNAVLTVKRVGDPTGAVSVNYATFDGNALAGVAYTATSGTLSWGDGDVSDRSIAIPVLQDAVLQGSRAFGVTLSGATGGASAGNETGTGRSVVVTIVDDEADTFPPNAVMPAGFAGDWVVSTPEGYQSPTSLASPLMPYESADMVYTGQLYAGTLSFRLKMNTRPGTGPFRFLIDGVEIPSLTLWPRYTTSDWQLITVEVPAGAHTLTWRTEFNPFGMEHVWIDDVTFPLPGPPGTPTGLTAMSGNGQLTISFTPSIANGSPITSYAANCMPGNHSASGTASPITVTGLTNGTDYTCTVTADSALGTSLPSASITATPVPGMQFTSANTATFRVLSSGSFSITSIGTPSTFSVTGTLPAGVTLSSAGLLSGTPTTGTAGTYPVIFTASPGGETQAFTLTVDKIPQSLDFPLPAEIVRGPTPYTLTATGGASGNPVVFSAATTQWCMTSGTNGQELTAVTRGLCMVDASQAGNVDYQAATTVRKNTYFLEYRALVVTAPTTHPWGGTATLASTHGTIGRPVTFTSLTPAICSTAGAIADFNYQQFLNGHIVTPVQLGLCRIRATVPAHTSWLPAETEFEITIVKRSQVISMTTRVSVAPNETIPAVIAGGASGLPVTLTTTTPAICSVSGLNVTGVNSGTCQLVANQPGDAFHEPAPAANKTLSVWPTFGLGSPRHELKLTDGRLFVFDGGQAVMFDPVANQWTPAAAPIVNHTYGAAVALADGRVLATGTNYGANVTVYNPTTNAWSNVQPMSRARVRHSLTLLADGRVLAAGGALSVGLDTPTSTTEIYDPIANTWTAGPNMSLPRTQHSATMMGDGRVFIIGGNSAGNVYYRTSEWYDPVANTWSQGDPLALPRSGHLATLLPNGSLLLTGGGSCQTNTRGECVWRQPGAQRYDPGTGWRTENANFQRWDHTATVLADGTLLLAGGTAGNGAVTTTNIYIPATDTYSLGPSMVFARGNHGAFLLPDGSVMLYGGGTIEILSSSMSLLGTQMPLAILGTPYGPHPLVTRGAMEPVTYALTGGALPPGLMLSSSGIVSGTPTQLGSFSATVIATDANSASDSADFSFLVERRKPVVTSSVSGANGTISPTLPQEVVHGGTVIYSLMPALGFAGQVGGTCPGSLSNDTFTAGPVTDDCTVVASFTQSAFPPAAPTITQVVAGPARLAVHFTPGADNGLPITGYNLSCTASNGNTRTLSGTSSPITLPNLFFESYRCKMTATNAMGTSVASAESDPVTPTPQAATVTVNRVGTNASGGRVVSNSAGIDCPGTCTASVLSNVNHTFTASVQQGTVLSGWSTTGSGCLEGRNDQAQCTIIFAGSTGTVTAILLSSTATAVPSPPLAVYGESRPSAILVQFQASFAGASPVTQFTATCTPSGGGTAVAASGPASPILVGGLIPGSSYTCTVKATSALGTSANSAASIPIVAGAAMNMLTVSLAGAGRGLVTSTPGGISCGEQCAGAYAPGTVVQLSAAPTAGSVFSGWSGGTGSAVACNGSMLACNVTLIEASTITATFSSSFTVTPAAAANGSISPATPQSVVSGSTTTFTVTPDAGYAASVGGTCGGSLVGNVYTTNAVVANCTVTASFASLITLTGVVSRKTHAGAGTFDRPIDRAPLIDGAITVEPRAIGSGHQIVFQFDQTVTTFGTATAVDLLGNPIGTVNAAINTTTPSELIVTLTGIPDATRVTVAVTGVNGAIGGVASVGFLVGDVNGSRTVSATDVTAVKSRSGQTLDTTNYQFDVNVTGTINASDVTAVKLRSGAAV